MTVPRLSKRAAAAKLSPPVARTFADGLQSVIEQAPGEQPTKQRLITRLVGTVGAGVEAAPFEALRPHAELFLTACIYVAVTDGRYGAEEARHVSQLAHRLGLSARQLEQLEARVFGELQVRGRGAGVPAAG